MLDARSVEIVVGVLVVFVAGLAIGAFLTPSRPTPPTPPDPQLTFIIGPIQEQPHGRQTRSD
jgi:hypothetical protein